AIGVHLAAGVKLRAEEGSFGCAGTPGDSCATRFGHELPFGFGLAVHPKAFGIDANGRLTFFAETHGYLPLHPSTPFNNAAVSELQVGLGSRVALGSFSILAGVEKGLLRGVGNANVRGLLAIGWAPRMHDRDGDGIPDENDMCPDLPEDFDGFQDADGCPDL